MKILSLAVGRGVALWILWMACAAHALDAGALGRLASGDSDERIAAINALVTEGDPRARDVLAAMAAGELQMAGEQILIVRGDKASDARTGAAVSPLPAERQDLVVNNRVRGAIANALAALRLVSPDRSERLAAARQIGGNPDASLLPLIRQTLAKEPDATIRTLLQNTAAAIEVKADDPAVRMAAVKTLGESNDASAKTLLLSVLEKKPDGSFVEADETLRSEAEKSLRAVESRLARAEWVGLGFAGLSLGSILLLAALGLAITYGLMGVINMAHGELIMIGAYTTFVVQNLFRAYTPLAFDWYIVAAVPASFLVAGAVGIVLERSVIRWLYGRPLETLLATWGISLVLIQAVRTIFGAQNVAVENPAFMSGGFQVLTSVVLPWNRVVIIGFAAAVLLAMWGILTRTRLGLLCVA